MDNTNILYGKNGQFAGKYKTYGYKIFRRKPRGLPLE